MALLLNVDTATELASVCVSIDGVSIALKENHQQKEHASFIHQAIEELMKKADVDMNDFDAFSVTSGPGSYTGLRVGMATVKGFCYALSKPLITVNTLEVMATAAIAIAARKNEVDLFCPMIDARRSEVFTATYNRDLACIMQPQAIILDDQEFHKLIAKQRVLFLGSGSAKFKALEIVDNGVFEEIKHSAEHLASRAEKAFHQKNFSDTSYSHPQYFKEFHSTAKV